MKILIIDDEDYKYNVLSKALNNSFEDLELYRAKSRNSALRLIKSNYRNNDYFDIVFCDNYMPLFDNGFDIKPYAKEIINYIKKSISNNLPVCLYSSEIEDGVDCDFSIKFDPTLSIESYVEKIKQIFNKKRIIFLDIDGVLNDLEYIMKSHENIKQMSFNNEPFDRIQFKHIDDSKVKLLKRITDETNSYIVITSSWKTLGVYPLVKENLIRKGLPIIGETKDYNANRGEGIKNYIKDNDIEEYIIIDDDIFSDYDEELLLHLVKTSYINGGLIEKHTDYAIKLLKKK